MELPASLSLITGIIAMPDCFFCIQQIPVNEVELTLLPA